MSNAFKRKVPPLFPDQKKAMAFELKQGSILDLSEPGTGKTRTRIEVFASRRTRGGKCMLVLAPKTLLRPAWEADFRKYQPWVNVSVATAANREKAFAANADVYVTNHDAVKWLAKKPRAFFDRFDYLVIDESDAFKHHTSQRSKAVAKIAKFFKYRVIMNGTLTPNGVLDAWHQVHLVDGGKRLGTSFFAFRNAVCSPVQVGPKANMVKWVEREGIEEQVRELIRDISVRNVLKGVPTNHKYVVPFYMNPAHMAAYVEMKKTAILELKEGQVSAVNAAALATKLLQIASGAVYDEEGNYQVIDRDRYELVADLVEARKNTVVFFLWTHQRDLLIEEFKKRKLTYMVIDGSVSESKRTESVQMYEAGMYRTCLLHPKSAAHGLTLVRGKATIWPSPTYDLGFWIQGNKRIDRTGQTEETETINIVAQGTYEEIVMDNMGVKNVRQSDLLAGLE